MATKLGMNAQLVRGVSGSVETQLGILDHAQASLAHAVIVSNHPISFALSPGSFVIAPWSIFQISSANADIALAKASARELLAKLISEAQAQEWASDAQDASYETGYAWRTPDARDVPAVSPWDFIPNPWTIGRVYLDAVGTVAGYVETALEWAMKYGPQAARDFSTWWDNLPPWASALKKIGRALPWVGTGVSTVDLAAELLSEDPDPWQVTRHSVSIGLDVASATATGTIVGAPAGLVLAGVGIVWDLAWDAAERGIEFGENLPQMMEYYEEVPWMAAVHFIAPITLDFWGPIAG
jgi:hypothetical protein